MTELHIIGGDAHAAEALPLREGDWLGEWMARCTYCGVRTYPLTSCEADMWVQGHDTALRPRHSPPPLDGGQLALVGDTAGSSA